MKTFKNWKGDLNDYLQPKDEIDNELYEYALNVLPPQLYENGLLQTGEPYSQDKSGHYTYASYVEKDNKFWYLGHLTTQAIKSKYIKEVIKKLINQDR